MPLLPSWLRYAWAAALVVVFVLHLRHAAEMRGEARRWHTGHILMAAGMVAMYLLPQHAHPHLYQVGVGVFAALTLAVLTSGVMARLGGSTAGWLWAAATLDMAIMTYMSEPHYDRDAPVTYVLVAYLVLEAGLWLVARRPGLPTESDLDAHGTVAATGRVVVLGAAPTPAPPGSRDADTPPPAGATRRAACCAGARSATSP